MSLLCCRSPLRQKSQALWPNEDSLNLREMGCLCAVPSDSCLGDSSALNQYPVNFGPHSDPSAAAHTCSTPLWRKTVSEQSSSGEQIRALDEPDAGLHISHLFLLLTFT